MDGERVDATICTDISPAWVNVQQYLSIRVLLGSLWRGAKFCKAWGFLPKVFQHALDYRKLVLWTLFILTIYNFTNVLQYALHRANKERYSSKFTSVARNEQYSSNTNETSKILPEKSISIIPFWLDKPVLDEKRPSATDHCAVRPKCDE